MPIYAYRCSNCGHAQDVLQRMSDPVLSVCPACGQTSYVKQVTAAGFQLKGSGWYVTDFRGDKKAAPGDGDKSDAKNGDGAPAGAEAKAGETAAPAGDASAKSGDASNKSGEGATKNGEGAKKAEAASATAAASSAAPAPAPAAPAPAPSGKPAG